MNAIAAAPPAPAASRSWLSPAWAVVAAYFLLIAQKPWALTTPQLWAEDGSLHLLDNERWGAGAFFMAHRGYLHLLPRVIAWLASRLTDVAHWPAFYNSAALLVAMVLFVRTASPRLALPGKPWLVLAFVLAAHTGEVFLTITNLHWLTAFLLLEQTLITRPTTPAQRAGDLALLIVAGLSGPFVLVFFPLFVWRYVRDRHVDNLLVLAVAGACAGTQAYFVSQAGGEYFVQTAAPLNPGMLLTVVGGRLVVWPLLGAYAARALPWSVVGAIGGVFLVALAVWVLRPHPRRALRAQILLAFVFIAPSTILRSRPDTWTDPDLVNADAYFYIPRILLAWLLIWECDSPRRWLAFAARGLCLLGIVLNLPHYLNPPPPNYQWAARCDAIRRGVPADIPILPEGWILHYPGRSPDAR